ncbi:PAN2-PAN3 deadenylation complex subunit PAN3 isoform X1 [Papilio machaon]|uniref:PAN2-PAN3 deadenylation complex subunit PAN3 isoform X1 n=1 Tax=Papilio machaon TaxID=76193 RepID=UPI001E6653BF|nr:PAN2-PAN3 deadenylation complex subunit PAN3 isoform X1 [Papilio machaon]
MDPSIYMQYSPPNGLPQESKLATYMNHSATTPTRSLNQSMGQLSLESSPPAMRKVFISEYVPMNYFTLPPPPTNVLPESPENSPPSTMVPVPNMQVHQIFLSVYDKQENVGGTTYFYSTNEGLNTSGALNSSASLANSESCRGGNPGPSASSSYASQMFCNTPTHMVPGPMISKPGPDPGLGVSGGPSQSSGYSSQMFCSTPTHMGPNLMVPKPVGAEACRGAGAVPSASSSYASQMFCSTPSHMVPGPMISKPAGAEQMMGASGGPSPSSGYPSQMYCSTPTHMGPSPIIPKSGLAESFYMPETIKAETYQRNKDIFLMPYQYIELPENVEMYSDLVPLEGVGPHSLTSSYRAAHRQSGEHIALRRLHAYSAMPSPRLDLWKQLDHPNVVRLQECFTTVAFGDNSLVMVYDYHPGCETLMSKYIRNNGAGNSSDSNGTLHDPFSSDPDAPRPYTHQKNAMLRALACGALLPEAVLWSFLVQLTAALRAIHTAGLACRTLDPSKVVMNGCRVRISWCGTADVIEHHNSIDIIQAQQDDLVALGRLALALACRSMHCDNLAASMDLVSRTYSADLQNLIIFLLTKSPGRRTVTDLMPMIGARFYTQVEALERRADVFEEQLAHEMDNGRLLRILIKLGVVNERPELNMDPEWSETGGRYMLKLFRDYVFHSVTEDGRPWFDQAHLTYCLNHLDSGSNTKVVLMSRDEQSVFVVTYAELKHCLEQAVEEVLQSAFL